MCLGLIPSLPLLLVAAAFTQRIRIVTPLCDRHRNYWLFRACYIWGGLAIFAFLVILLIVVGMVAELRHLLLPLGAGTVAGFLGWLISGALLQTYTLRVVELDDCGLKLQGVAQGFTQALREWRQRSEENPVERSESPADPARGGTISVEPLSSSAPLLVLPAGASPVPFDPERLVRPRRRVWPWVVGAITGCVAVGLVAVYILFAFGIRPAQARQHQMEGWTYLSRGDDVRALASFDEAIRLNRRCAEAYYGRGQVYLNRNQPDRAAAEFDDAIGCGLKNADVYINRGYAYQSSGMLDQAIVDYSEGIRLDPANVTALVNRGGIYVTQGMHRAGIADYSQALRLDPRNADAYLGRGRAHLGMGSLIESVTDCTAVLHLRPNDSFAFATRGTAYHRRKDPTRALADYGAALRLVPGFRDCVINRGLLHAETGEHDKAIVDFTRAVELQPEDPVAYNHRAASYSAQGEHDRALADCNEAIRRSPQFMGFTLSRAQVLKKKGDYKLALADFRTGMTSNPPSAEAFNGAAWMLCTCPADEARDGKQAVEYALKACALTNWGNANGVDTLAAAYAEVGDFVQAVSWQKKALQTPGLSPEGVEHAQQRLKLYEEGKPYRER